MKFHADVGDCAEIVGEAGRVVPVGDMFKFAGGVRFVVEAGKKGPWAVRHALRSKNLRSRERLGPSNMFMQPR